MLCPWTTGPISQVLSIIIDEDVRSCSPSTSTRLSILSVPYACELRWMPWCPAMWNAFSNQRFSSSCAFRMFMSQLEMLWEDHLNCNIRLYIDSIFNYLICSHLFTCSHPALQLSADKFDSPQKYFLQHGWTLGLACNRKSAGFTVVCDQLHAFFFLSGWMYNSWAIDICFHLSHSHCWS